ncbi:MAG: hypothetical protein ACKV0T_20955 [Planctomycetales bacterium]
MNTTSDSPLAPVPQPESSVAERDARDAERTRDRLRNLPPEVGMVVVAAGVAGLLLPVVPGTPLLLLGGLILSPDGFAQLDGWVQRWFPRMHRYGFHQIDRFLDDFDRRYPEALALPGEPACPPQGKCGASASDS